MNENPRQNRVTPNGEIIATTARGTLMGNRGILHDEGQRIIRPYASKAWIICRLHFRQRRRVIMSPNRYTELFFLDEATALAAGHRPCFECQRSRTLAFREAWVAANPKLIDGTAPRIGDIDKVLHQERLTKARRRWDRCKRTYTAALDSLPNGAFIAFQGDAHLVWEGALLPWSPFGYGTTRARPTGIDVTVLTPHATVGALNHGYEIDDPVTN